MTNDKEEQPLTREVTVNLDWLYVVEIWRTANDFLVRSYDLGMVKWRQDNQEFRVDL